VLQLEEKLRELKLANQRLARNSRGNFAELSRSMEQTVSFWPTRASFNCPIKMQRPQIASMHIFMRNLCKLYGILNAQPQDSSLGQSQKQSRSPM